MAAYWVWQVQVIPFCDYKLGRIESPLPQRSVVVVVVVSPLVSLMVDQVTSLRLRGVSAAILSGFQGGDHQLQANGGRFVQTATVPLRLCSKQ